MNTASQLIIIAISIVLMIIPIASSANLEKIEKEEFIKKSEI
jgi:hypothetical protein